MGKQIGFAAMAADKAAIQAILSRMSKAASKSSSSPFESGFIEGIYDHAITMIDDLPLISPSDFEGGAPDERQ